MKLHNFSVVIVLALLVSFTAFSFAQETQSKQAKPKVEKKEHKMEKKEHKVVKKENKIK